MALRGVLFRRGMTDTEHDALTRFAENVLTNLEKNGFPGRRVSFPIERLYESAHAKGVNFNKVLDVLGARGIGHEKTPEKIVFHLEGRADASAGADPFAGLDVGALAGLSPDEQMAAAAELLKRMTPEQLTAIRGLVENLSDAEKAELLARARALGIE